MPRQYAMGLAIFLVAVGGACRKKAPAPATRASAVKGRPTVSCPSPSEIVKVLGAPEGSSVELDCLPFPDSMFWMAGALVRGAKPADPVRLALVSGSPYARWLVYDVAPAPTQAIQQLVGRSEEVQVKMRGGRRERRLVRIGVIGRAKKGGEDSDEVAVLLKLGAHAPPEIVWMGPGDQTQKQGECTVSRTVDFELLFGTRVEMFVSERSRGGAKCTPGADTQETVTARPVRMQPGRPVPGTEPPSVPG